MKNSDNFSEADLCVKCGLCIPHCPTYKHSLDESESPRGRLSLMQGWSNGALDSTPSLLRHMDNCLLCRACEKVCPAEVPFGRLMDQFRSENGKSEKQIKPRMTSFAARSILRNRTLSKLCGSLLEKIRRSGYTDRLQNVSLLELDAIRWLSQAKAGNNRQPEYPAIGTTLGTVGLFIGCTGDLLQTGTVDASIQILNRLGFRVVVADHQTCCGAMDLHAGNQKSAAKLARQNIAAFTTEKFDAVITLATGCAAMLYEYPLHFPDCDQFSATIRDICDFVAERIQVTPLNFHALDKKLCIHTPCSLKNVLQKEQPVQTLIGKIPVARLHTLPEITHCCGAAGTYMLEHPVLANNLRNDVIHAIDAIDPDILLTSNVGCCLHLGAGLSQQNKPIEIMHPVELLARQIDPGRAPTSVTRPAEG